LTAGFAAGVLAGVGVVGAGADAADAAVDAGAGFVGAVGTEVATGADAQPMINIVTIDNTIAILRVALTFCSLLFLKVSAECSDDNVAAMVYLFQWYR
jgi:hypothetical protein